MKKNILIYSAVLILFVSDMPPSHFVYADADKAAPSAGETEPEARFEKVAQRLAKGINEKDYQMIRADFNKIMLDALTPEQLEPVISNVLAEHRRIERLGKPHIIWPNQAIFPAHCQRGIFDIKIVLDAQDKIAGLWLLPHIPRELPTVEKHQTSLALPFNGKWSVFWGGDTIELNQHFNTPNQKYALDLLIVGPNSKTHKTDGKKNTDFYAFGKEVLACADGIVTDVITGVRDNRPGSMNPYSALGNAVFIQHQENEISVIAHLKFDSTKVKVGDKVKTGQVIGLCGNSGNSSEPHIHFHLQNTPVIQDGSGIKCRFEKVLVEEKSTQELLKEHSPIKGQVISNG